ncbi:hypothetical protein, partial [Desulforhopalus vacuolatus]|uniref:hypothetical protein n=1 Tax=Desulforhopalus vacuolatus TaxID=40414 RepID=UPI001964C625
MKVSPGRPGLDSVYKNKWESTYSIQWKLNEQLFPVGAKKRPEIDFRTIGCEFSTKPNSIMWFLSNNMQIGWE